MIFKGTFAFLMGALAAVHADKDDEYYRAGMGNPNVDMKMYWADAHNILQDLDQFSALYVQYHNCAWTQNTNQYEEQESGSGDENDYWYMGATPNYAANVAFSVYGALAGEKFSGCNEYTFINSFTTNQGFEPFAQSIYYAGATSTDYSQSYSSECQGGAGVACDYNIGFAYVSYNSDTCDPYYASGITDNMSYMNSAFQNAQCVKIYDSSMSYSNNNNNRDLNEKDNTQQVEGKTADSETEDRNLQNNYGYGYNGADGYNGAYGYNGYSSYYYAYSGTPLALLFSSSACFIQNYWNPDNGCPDPYGKLAYYQENFNKGVRKSMKIDTYVTYRANMEIGKKYVKIGGLLFMTAAILFLTEQLIAYKARKALGGKAKTPRAGKKQSVVELVSSTGGKIKKSAATRVKKAVAKVSGKKKASKVEKTDGIMVDYKTEEPAATVPSENQ